MTDSIIGPVLVAAALGVIAFAALKLGWGVALWARRPAFRVGDRWGDELAEVEQWSGEAGYVRAGGEVWRAISIETLRPGDRVCVMKTNGLTLEVRKA